MFTPHNRSSPGRCIYPRRVSQAVLQFSLARRNRSQRASTTDRQQQQQPPPQTSCSAVGSIHGERGLIVHSTPAVFAGVLISDRTPLSLAFMAFRPSARRHPTGSTRKQKEPERKRRKESKLRRDPPHRMRSLPSCTHRTTRCSCYAASHTQPDLTSAGAVTCVHNCHTAAQSWDSRLAQSRCISIGPNETDALTELLNA